MTIIYTNDKPIYKDATGKEIHEGDTVFMDGRDRKVYATEDGYLGTDATNPYWIAKNMAVECEYGIYQFTEADNPVLVERR